MRKFLVILVLLMPTGVLAETFDELMDSIEAPIPGRAENGVINGIDLENRILHISGYDYHVSPAFGENTTEISLYGSSFGAFELLSVGMKVEVEYMDLGHARVAMVISELDPTLEVEH